MSALSKIWLFLAYFWQLLPKKYDRVDPWKIYTTSLHIFAWSYSSRHTYIVARSQTQPTMKILVRYLNWKTQAFANKWLKNLHTKCEASVWLECICCPLKNQVIVLTGSEATLQTMETFLPLGTVKYIEVGDNWGAHANSARLKLWMWMPTSLRGPWHDGSTIRGTLLWVSHSLKLRSRQSQVHLKCNAEQTYFR